MAQSVPLDTLKKVRALAEHGVGGEKPEYSLDDSHSIPPDFPLSGMCPMGKSTGHTPERKEKTAVG